MLRCIHGDVRPYCLWWAKVVVGRVCPAHYPHISYSAIIGRDWPNLTELMAQVVAWEGAAEDDGTGEGGVQEDDLAPPDDIRTMQREDPMLRAALEQAAQQEPHGEGPYFHLRDDILYRVGQNPTTWEELDQLVVLQPLRAMALWLAHNIPTAGHLAADNTRNRLT